LENILGFAGGVHQNRYFATGFGGGINELNRWRFSDTNRGKWRRIGGEVGSALAELLSRCGAAAPEIAGI
jgi:hypothetical protein